MTQIEEIRTFSGYVWKIHSRCNLNCSYCYMYNLADQGWTDQPKRMTESTAILTAERMRDHCSRRGRRRVNITLHGGEPLLVGVDYLQFLLTTIKETLRPAGITPKITIQTNGLLFNEKFGRLLTKENVSLGVSIDGPPRINDKYRLDHKGQPTSARLEDRLQLLVTEFPQVFAGFLCVISPEADPVETFEYLLSFRPSVINFLLPLDNYDRRPAGKEHEVDNELYGEWLCKAFDQWAKTPQPVKVLFFNSIINLLCGRSALTESHGTGPVDLVVIETNGDIEAVDSMKATFEGATKLGLNVFESDFDDAARHLKIMTRQMGLDGLCGTCKACDLVEICGGGDLPNRYSKRNGFDNPSVFCTDIKRIVTHIRQEVGQAISSKRTA